MSSVNELKSRLSRLSPDEFRDLKRWMEAQAPGPAQATGPPPTRDQPGEERARFQHLFEHTPVATWLEDWTALGQWLEQLREQGVEDLNAFLSQHPEQVRHALSLIRVRDVNQAAVEQNAARSKADLLAHLSQLFTETTYERFIEQLNALWRGDGHFEYESRSQRLDGRPLDLIISIDIPRHGPDQARDFTNVIVTGTDITARKQAEEALRESEQRFRLTFDQSPIGASIVSLDFRYLQVNDQLCRLTGYSAAELTRRRFTDITHPEDSGRDSDQARKLAAGEIEQHSMEKRYVRKDGAIVWVQLSSRLLRDAAGRPLCFLALVQDINARKQAEAGLGQLAAIIDSSEDAIISESLDGKIVSWNAGAERLYGYSAADSIGRSVAMLFPVEHSDEVALILERVKRGERLRHFETVQRTQTGQLVAVSLTISPVKDAAGHLVGVSMVARDISERKQAEQERERLIQELQKALADVKTLSGLLPICAQCKKIRDDKGYWNQIEFFIRDRSHARFTHSICPDCARKLYPELYGEKSPGPSPEK